MGRSHDTVAVGQLIAGACDAGVWCALSGPPERTLEERTVTTERPGEQEGIKPLIDDTQGHGGKFRPFTPDAERPAQPGEQQAQAGEREMYRPGRVTDEADTEG